MLSFILSAPLQFNVDASSNFCPYWGALQFQKEVLLCISESLVAFQSPRATLMSFCKHSQTRPSKNFPQFLTMGVYFGATFWVLWSQHCCNFLLYLPLPPAGLLTPRRCYGILVWLHPFLPGDSRRHQIPCFVEECIGFPGLL
jgi:hypothetical protein